MIPIHAIIFDLDDTLIHTSKIYHQSRIEFVMMMTKLGFTEHDLLDKLDEIDITHIHQQGFIKERYPLSLVKTYHYYSRKSGMAVNPVAEKEIADIGWRVFQQKPEQIEGAERVLKELKDHYFLILATLGDPEIQGKKITQSGLRPYFSAIYVLSTKSAEEYRQIIKEQSLKEEETWLIGNSIRSDLNPGLKLGLHCILIPAKTWKFEEEKPISNQYLRLNTLVEVLKYL